MLAVHEDQHAGVCSIGCLASAPLTRVAPRVVDGRASRAGAGSQRRRMRLRAARCALPELRRRWAHAGQFQPQTSVFPGDRAFQARKPIGTRPMRVRPEQVGNSGVPRRHAGLAVVSPLHSATASAPDLRAAPFRPSGPVDTRRTSAQTRQTPVFTAFSGVSCAPLLRNSGFAVFGALFGCARTAARG